MGRPYGTGGGGFDCGRRDESRIHNDWFWLHGAMNRAATPVLLVGWARDGLRGRISDGALAFDRTGTVRGSDLSFNRTRDGAG